MPQRKLFSCLAHLGAGALLMCARPASAAESSVLSLDGAKLRHDLRGGGTQTYAVSLAAGSYVEAEVVQRGIDVVVAVLSPTDSVLAEVDSPNGSDGPEPVQIRADRAGTYRLVVRALDAAAPAGAIEARVTLHMSASAYARHSETTPPLTTLLPYTGAYRFASGALLSVDVFGDAGLPYDILGAVDTGTRRLDLLHAHAPDTFFTGPTVMQRYPVRADWRFVRDANGEVTAVELRESGRAPRRALRVRGMRSEDITVASSALKLTGTLHLPAGKGPFPAIVIVPGSGPANRFAAGPLLHFFTAQGFAVFACDKRGVGGSSGDWRTAPLDSLAGDIVAQVDLLRGRADIDGARIGLWGVSQGGWVGSLAAARSPHLAFMVIHAGSGVPVWENVVHECVSAMRDAGLSGEALERGRTVARRVFSMASEGASPEAVVNAALPDSTAPGIRQVWLLSTPPQSPWWNWFRDNGRVDAAEVLPRVRIPVLWFLGDRDSQVPSAESAERLRTAFTASGSRNARVVMLRRAGHPFLDCETGLRSELPRLSHFAPGYLDAMAEWLAPFARGRGR